MLFGGVAVVAGLVLAGAPLKGAWPASVSCAVFFVGLACLVSGRFRTAAACVLGAMALVLLLSRGFVPWLGAAMLAVMFVGTAIHRWEQGTGGLWPVAVAAVLVALAPVWSIQAGWWWVQPAAWFITIALAGGDVRGRDGPARDGGCPVSSSGSG